MAEEKIQKPHLIQRTYLSTIEPITVYRCPICDHEEEDYDRAVIHANQPKLELPKGLVYKIYRGDDPIDHSIVLGITGYELNHNALHSVLYLYHSQDIDSYGPHHGRLEEISEFIKDLKSGKKISLLSEQEFEEFVKKHPDAKESYFEETGFVRTTPELEEMLRQGGSS